MHAWLRFLGIYLAEGTMLKRDVRYKGSAQKRYAVQIAAVKPRERQFVEAVLREIGIEHFFAPRDRFVFSNRQIYEALATLGLEGVKAGEKFVPRFVFKQGDGQIAAFLEGHFAGDGSLCGTTRVHYTGSAQLADDLQTLMFLAGHEAHISVREARSSVTADGRTITGRLPQHRVAMCERKNLSIERKKTIRFEPYAGEVFCAEMPVHHTLVTRRNGKILISGNCVLNASVGAVEILLGIEKLQPAMLSRLFLYWVCREKMGTLKQDSGTYPHLAAQMLASVGVCRETTWNYAKSNLFVGPPPSAYPEAYDNKIAGSYRLDAKGAARLAQLETCVRSNHPVVFGTPVDDAIQAYQKGQVLGVPNEKKIEGGHAMLVVGVRRVNGARAWVIRNSWGLQYGDYGHLLINDAFMSWPLLDDLIVYTRVEALVF